MNQSSKRRVRVGEVAKAVLMVIAAAGIVSAAIVAPNALQILAPFFKKKKYSSKQAVKRTLDSLIRSGLVKRTLDSHGVPFLELSKKGVWEISIRKGIMSSTNQKKWDGYWRVVIFDVPNAKGSIRSELRRGMKLFGFKQLQKSVWVYPYECSQFIELLKSHLEVSQDVLVMEAASIENDRHLRKEFKI